jgi:hypothetical protein
MNLELIKKLIEQDQQFIDGCMEEEDVEPVNKLAQIIALALGDPLGPLPNYHQAVLALTLARRAFLATMPEEEWKHRGPS